MSMAKPQWVPIFIQLRYDLDCGYVSYGNKDSKFWPRNAKEQKNSPQKNLILKKEKNI